MGEDLSGQGTRVQDGLRANEYVVPALKITEYRTKMPRAITDTVFTTRCIELGTTFTAVSIDTGGTQASAVADN